MPSAIHTGDVLLVEVARRLQRITASGARSAGSAVKFAVVVPDVTMLDDVVALAQEICSAAKRPFFLEQLGLEVSMSIDVAVAPTHANDSRTLFNGPLWRCAKRRRIAPVSRSMTRGTTTRTPAASASSPISAMPSTRNSSSSTTSRRPTS